MPITVKHTYVSSIPDSGDTTLVQPSNWNADHTLIGLGTMAEQNANAVAITGGSITGVSGIGTVTSVTGTSPVVSSGGNTPAISMPVATASVSGYLSSTDWNTFNNKSNVTTSYSRTSFTATASQTTFTVTYTVGYIEVFLNGVLLNGADYTATNGTTVVLSIGAASGDIIETIAYNTSAVYVPTIGTITSASTITPVSANAQYNVTALAVTATVAIPSGSPADGQKLMIRIKDNGTAQTLNWTTTSGGYRVIGTTLPTTTVISKVLYIECIYNAQDTFWDVVATAQQ